MAVTTEFASFVDGHLASEPELPFVHSTRCEFFENLCRDGVLSPRDCPVFNEPLLYFFYGRPAYRSRTGATPDTNLMMMPVCLVFKPGVIDKALRRAFPFDTGAAASGMFTPHVKGTEVSDFSISSTLNGIKKSVSAFFDCNRNYFTAIPGSLCQGKPTGFHTVDCYCRLISDHGPTIFDDRRAVIEVQTSQPVPLRDNLLAVVVPTPFLDEPSVRDAILSQWRTYPLRYNHIRGTIASEYVRVIAEKVAKYLREGGYFHE